MIGLFLVGLLATSCFEPAADSGSLDLAEIMAIEAPRDRAARFNVYLEQATLADLPEITTSFRKNRLRLDPATATLFALWWTNQDPVSAYNDGLASRWLEGPVWASIVIREWARIAPEAALEGVRESIKREAGRDWERTLVLSLVAGWFDGEEVGAEPLIAFIGELTPGRPLKEGLDAVLKRMIKLRGSDQAIALVEGLPGHDEIGRNAFKRDAFLRLASQLTAKDVKRAVAWATQHADGPFGDGLLIRVGRRWGRIDGRRALEWAMSLPDSDKTKVAVMTETMRAWTGSDGAASVDWIDARPKPLSPELQPLLKLSVMAMASAKQPGQAMARVDRLDDGEFKQELVIAVGQIWRRVDAEGAEAWLAEAGLPPEVEREVRTAPQTRKGPAARRAGSNRPAPPGAVREPRRQGG